MREILFKAKRIDNEDWIIGYLTYIFKGTNMCIIENDTGIRFVCNSKTLCQYTGLTDKNGQKIWENDIIQVSGEGTYKVIWNDEDAMFVLECEEDVCAFDYYCSSNLEFIGNVFDTPELLEGGAK